MFQLIEKHVKKKGSWKPSNIEESSQKLVRDAKTSFSSLVTLVSSRALSAMPLVPRYAETLGEGAVNCWGPVDIMLPSVTTLVNDIAHMALMNGVGYTMIYLIFNETGKPPQTQKKCSVFFHLGSVSW